MQTPVIITREWILHLSLCKKSSVLRKLTHLGLRMSSHSTFEFLKIHQPKVEILQFVESNFCLFLPVFATKCRKLAKVSKSCLVQISMFQLWADKFSETQKQLLKYKWIKVSTCLHCFSIKNVVRILFLWSADNIFMLSVSFFARTVVCVFFLWSGGNFFMFSGLIFPPTYNAFKRNEM